jgi:uncharacterized protein (DUF58 family)
MTVRLQIRSPAPILAHAKRLAQTLGPLQLATQRAATGLAGAHGKRREGPGTDFWQFRPLAAGESAERIDWRRSARSDTLYVRAREWEAPSRLLIGVCPDASMHYASRPDLPEKHAAGLTLALALALAAVAAGETVIGYGGNGKSADSEAGVTRLAETLTRQSRWGATEASASHAVLVVDGLQTPVTGIVDTLRGLGPLQGHLVHVTDPAERALPFTGAVLLHGDAAPLDKRFDGIDAIKPRYAERWAAHCTALETAAAHCHWRYWRLDTDARLEPLAGQIADAMRQA